LTEKEDEKEQSLGWKDYVAIVIAMLTTTLLPIIILVLILLVAVIFAVAHFR
jgi:hypothetical protein